MHASLVEQEEDEEDEEGSEESSSDSASRAEALTVPTFDVPYFRYIDEDGGTEGEEEWSSSRSLSSIEEDSSSDSVVSDRYVVVSGTPEKILEHLLNDLRLDEDQGTTQAKESGQQHQVFNVSDHPFSSHFSSHLAHQRLGHVSICKAERCS